MAQTLNKCNVMRPQLHGNLVLAPPIWADSTETHDNFGNTNRQPKGVCEFGSRGVHLGVFLVALVADVAILLTQVLHLHSGQQAAAMAADAPWLTQQS